MNFEFLVNVPLLLQNLYRFLYILMEVLPFLRIIHKIFRADLSRHVVVADHVIRLQIKLHAEVCAEVHQCLICTVLKLSGLIRVAALDGDRVTIAVVGCVGHLI